MRSGTKRDVGRGYKGYIASMQKYLRPKLWWRRLDSLNQFQFQFQRRCPPSQVQQQVLVRLQDTEVGGSPDWLWLWLARQRASSSNKRRGNKEDCEEVLARSYQWWWWLKPQWQVQVQVQV